MPYIEPNNWYHKFINWTTIQYIQAFEKTSVPLNANAITVSPLWVAGYFRSGTSLVTRMLNEMGLDIGPQAHLLKSQGKRANLNPEGFYENYLFMDWSLFVFHKSNSWGHLPPSTQKLLNLNLAKEARAEFIKFSVSGVHDDRISNKQKAQILKKYDHLRLINYLEDNFNAKCAIKNPHFSILYPLLFSIWPNSKILICLRNPQAAISSAVNITNGLNEDSYCRYCESILKIPSEKVIYFSFDNLIKNPEESIRTLANEINADENGIKRAIKSFNPNLVRANTNLKVLDITNDLYHKLLIKSINK